MIKVKNNYLPLLSLLLTVSINSSALAETCTKPKVKGYEYVGCLHDGLAGVIKKSADDTEKVGYINQAGKIIIPTIYDVELTGEGGETTSTNDFSEGLAVVHKSITAPGIINDKYGFIDTTGKIVIPLNFDEATGFSEGLASVKKNDKWGVIDKSGKTVIAFQYDQVGSFSEGLAPAQKNDKWGVIDKSGKTVIAFQYSQIGNFSEGLAPVEKNGKWGFIDKLGKIIIPTNLSYTFVDSFSEGLATVYKNWSTNDDNKRYGYINKTGKLVIPMNFFQSYGNTFDEDHNFKNGKAKVMDSKEKTFCINTQGARVNCN